MKTSQIVNMTAESFMNLSENQLRKFTSQIAKTANRRMKSLESKGISSPASRYAKRGGAKFGIAGKSTDEVKAEFMRAKGFLESQTSTVKGWNKFVNDSVKGLEERGIKIDKEDFDKLWKAYDDLAETDPEIKERQFKYMTLNEISNTMAEDPDASAESIANKIHERLSELYEKQAAAEQQARREAGADVSSFFEV